MRVSDTGTSIPNLNFVSTDCDGVDSVLVAKLNGSDVNFENGEDKSSDRKAKVYSGDVKELSELDGVSVKQDDLQGPNSGHNTVGYMGIRDKGGGLASYCTFVEYFQLPEKKTGTVHLDCKPYVVHNDLGLKEKSASAVAHSEAFTGVHGILELGDCRLNYFGKGILKAEGNVNGIIGPALIDDDPREQIQVDDYMFQQLERIRSEWGWSKQEFRENTISAVSLYVRKAGANLTGNKTLILHVPIKSADIADGDKELSISFFWNMCVYLLLPLLVKQPTLAASVTESLAYHINHQMEDKNVVHALLYEEGFNIEFFEKPEDMSLKVLIESLQTHDDCVAVLEGLEDKSIDSELVGVIRDSWILKPKSVSVTWDWSKVVKEDSKTEIIVVLCKDAEGLSLTTSAIESSYFYGQTTTFMITFECKLVCKCLFQVAQAVPSTIAFKGLGKAAIAAAKTANVRDIAIVLVGIIPGNNTFDNGGYNIMTGSGCSIELMKFDMGSAAATLGASKAIVQTKPFGVEFYFIVAACEKCDKWNRYEV
ncbi:hypothetical protein ACLB2K_029479 [Fragaria x ananassa]